MYFFINQFYLSIVMAPSLFQLQTLGHQDKYLTSLPELNFFKYVYSQNVNYAIDVVKLQSNDQVDFGKNCNFKIPKNGHFLYKLFLHIKLPALVKSSGSYLSWIDSLGFGIFDGPIKFEVDGIVVEELYPQLSDMLYELSKDSINYNNLVLKSDLYIASKYNALTDVDLMIPLDFWFTQSTSLSLPLLSMFKQDININFKLKSFLNVVNYDGSEPSPVSITDCQLIAQYIFVDDSISLKMQDSEHRYIIKQSQFNNLDIISENAGIHSSPLIFNHPVSHLLFACVDMSNFNSNNIFNYSRQDNNSPIISEVSLSFDGIKRFDFLPESYYRLAFPYTFYPNVPQRYIYTIPFSTNPLSIYPSGSINFSRFSDSVLSFKLSQNNPKSLIYIYAINYNILTINKGNFVIEYSV